MRRFIVYGCIFLLGCAQSSDGAEPEGSGAGDTGSVGGNAAGSGGVGGIGGAGGSGGAACPADYGDCDGDSSNGCETYLASHAQHCGVCDNICPDGLNAIGLCLESMCALSCAGGYDDCDSDPGCEAELATDDNNCGMCGEVCTGSCSDSMCGPGVLAGNQNHPARVTVDATNVYWVNLGTLPSFADSEIKQLPIAGGPEVTLASNQSTVFALAVDATDVYWCTNGTSASGYADSTIMKVAIGGGSPQVLATTQAAMELVVDGGVVYWTSAGTSPNYVDGAIYSIPVTGGSPTAVATGLNKPSWLVSGTNDLFFVTSNDDTIHKVAKAGGSPTALHSTTPITGLHHFGQTVYYSVFGKGLETIAVTGGMPNKFAPSVGARFMADDGVDLFWADEATGPPTGIVHRKPLVGGAVPSPYITGQDSPWDVDIDATNVYWANFGDTSSANGSIMFQPR